MMSTVVTEIPVTTKMLTDILGLKKDAAQVICKAFSSHDTVIDVLYRYFIEMNICLRLDEQDLALEDHVGRQHLRGGHL